MNDHGRYFDTATVAKLLGVHRATVPRWGAKNTQAGRIIYGPPYELHGDDVLYPVPQFREWAAHAELVNGVLRTPPGQGYPLPQ